MIQGQQSAFLLSHITVPCSACELNQPPLLVIGMAFSKAKYIAIHSQALHVASPFLVFSNCRANSDRW